MLVFLLIAISSLSSLIVSRLLKCVLRPFHPSSSPSYLYRVSLTSLSRLHVSLPQKKYNRILIQPRQQFRELLHQFDGQSLSLFGGQPAVVRLHTHGVLRLEEIFQHTVHMRTDRVQQDGVLGVFAHKKRGLQHVVSVLVEEEGLGDLIL